MDSSDDVEFKGFDMQEILLGDGAFIRNMPMTDFCPVIDTIRPKPMRHSVAFTHMQYGFVISQYIAIQV